MRENADNRLYGNLGRLAPRKASRPGMQIAVGGCLSQKDRDTIVRKAPWMDVGFGTENIGELHVLLERAQVQEEAQVEIAESLEAFPSTLPTRRESAYAAWVSISVGCNNTCTFCIVPALRGKEKDRRPGDILAEVAAHARRPGLVVGFAAETNDLPTYARDKLERKRLDLICANRVGVGATGFESDDNALRVLGREGLERALGPASKTELAASLLDLIAERLR